jgi:hypothetical protein
MTCQSTKFISFSLVNQTGADKSKHLGFLREEDLSLIEPKVVEIEKVLNGLICALRDD